jgi:hypothetical protein
MVHCWKHVSWLSALHVQGYRPGWTPGPKHRLVSMFGVFASAESRSAILHGMHHPSLPMKHSDYVAGCHASMLVLCGVAITEWARCEHPPAAAVDLVDSCGMLLAGIQYGRSLKDMEPSWRDAVWVHKLVRAAMYVDNGRASTTGVTFLG